MPRAFKVVDAFSAKPLLGNPVAVVLDGSGLTDNDMQAIAGWTNLSETTFVLPPTKPGADYRLRIFNPAAEMPFAGHPTLGSAHAVLEAGVARPRHGKLVQECGVGLVDVAVNGEGPDRILTLTLPPATVTSLTDDEIDEVEAILRHPILRDARPAIINVGAVWIIAQLASIGAVLGLQPDLVRSAAFERRKGATGITVFATHSEGSHDIEVRTFAPSCGVNEDPVCGSGNGSVAVFRSTRGLLPAGGTRYKSEQGRRVGRDGKISVAVDADGRVHVGGACVTTVDGLIAS
ncbi:PhzF family phenazine biosynthesis protein [Bradyrhizobium sp. CIAT3101]|uniref:PhzF family phenazine biosynthesis protein n=1 Tax=Bradyrhizobium sp. CIAT3101 TaxID=439387 RepID=UPI0024B1A328|nr:PhzF family phenazine biosynthesis protein [Bradyrhizobium sp. CIAT3101]WFU84270.1 PhzF family phenazine biosynthesis protein [Bradyrhizobium sp. CIAT3101]